ncbi:MAG: hypothetical protein M0008_01330, partial [Actinomycetota bacterium]|nr:hypothetical protein [Actinomycetota bacterium]
MLAVVILASTRPALSAALFPQPPQRTAGPRSAGRIDGANGTRVRGGTRCRRFWVLCGLIYGTGVRWRSPEDTAT